MEVKCSRNRWRLWLPREWWGQHRCISHLLATHLQALGGTTLRREDGVQALCLALGLAATLVRHFVAGGGRLFAAAGGGHSDEDADWPLEAYSGWLGTSGAPGT